ncbi:MAG: helix-turn-helix domain-containing protein [Geminicoccaceae bacterium]
MADRTQQPQPVDIEVGRRMRLRRQLLGMSQETLAARIGVSYQQVQKYERGTNRLGSSRLHRLAEVLQVPVAWFFAEDGPAAARRPRQLEEDPAPGFRFDGPGAGPATEPAEPVPDRDGVELLRAYSRIADPLVRRRLLELARSLARSAGQT